MSVVAIGINQRSAPLELLERMAVGEDLLGKALADLSSRSSLSDVVVLSTCMRTEVYAVAERFHGAIDDVTDYLAHASGVAREMVSEHLYCFYGEGAVTHLFTVASGLDSAVLGEGEVLGQVRHAWDRSREEGSAGPAISALFRHAIEVGKRARTETSISRGITSVSQAAVALVEQRLGSLANLSVVVIGAGDMGEGMASFLAGKRGGRRPREVVVVNRTWDKAVDLAGRIGAEAVPMSDLGGAMVGADVILTSTDSPAAVLSGDELALTMAERPDRPLLVVDVAVPRDVDPSAAQIDGITLLDMDDLSDFAQSSMQDRRSQAGPVAAIVAEEVQRYLNASSARGAAPLVSALRDQAEAIRLVELDRHRGRLGDLSDRQWEAVEALSRGILAKVLHEPTVRIKETAGSPRGERLAEAMRTLFDL
ncbi:MAG: glutamyl-tRNA reductase [Acidimicrobiales bacterium]